MKNHVQTKFLSVGKHPKPVTLHALNVNGTPYFIAQEVVAAFGHTRTRFADLGRICNESEIRKLSAKFQAAFFPPGYYKSGRPDRLCVTFKGLLQLLANEKMGTPKGIGVFKEHVASAIIPELTKSGITLPKEVVHAFGTQAAPDTTPDVAKIIAQARAAQKNGQNGAVSMNDAMRKTYNSEREKAFNAAIEAEPPVLQSALPSPSPAGEQSDPFAKQVADALSTTTTAIELLRADLKEQRQMIYLMMRAMEAANIFRSTDYLTYVYKTHYDTWAVSEHYERKFTLEINRQAFRDTVNAYAAASGERYRRAFTDLYVAFERSGVAPGFKCASYIRHADYKYSSALDMIAAREPRLIAALRAFAEGYLMDYEAQAKAQQLSSSFMHRQPG